MMWDKVIQVGVTAVCVIAGGIGLKVCSNQKKLADRFDASVKDLATISKDKIQEAVVERAVRSAAHEQLSRCMERIKADVESDAKSQLDLQARKAVLDAKNNIADSVSKKIAEEVAMIDIDDLKKSARARAEEKIVSKFDGSLDDILSKYNENLANVQRIYSGIADAIGKTKSAGKEIKFSLD